MSFGRQILQPALSLDALDESQLAGLSRIIERYAKQILGIDSTKIDRAPTRASRSGC